MTTTSQPTLTTDDTDTARRWPIATRFGVASVLADLSVHAAERDRTGASPAAEITRLQQAGIPALRIPTAAGGQGISLTELFGFVAELADADPNVAHALRNHFGFVESTLRGPADSTRRRYLAGIAEYGHLFGGSFSELQIAKAGLPDFATTLTEQSDGYLLDGDKFYSTGNIYSDYLLVKAVRADRSPVTVVVPADRPGIDLTDDWDGIGQRRTGSGSTRYRQVAVAADEIIPNAEFEYERDNYTATFPQLYLTTVIAGILRSITADAVALVRGRRRNYYHGAAEEPREEAAVQATVGQLSVNSHTADAVVAVTARTLETAWNTTDSDREAALLRASLDAARAKISVDDLAARSGWSLFETGGASSIRAELDLDRHWRNARTIASHNPDSYKLRYLGDHLLNGTRPPTGAFF